MAAKKKTSRRPAASKSKKPAARKATGRKTPAKAPGKKSAGRKSAATRGKRVAAAVQATARRGLSAAKQGFDRIKSSTSHLVEEVRERLAGDEERTPSDNGR